MPLISEEELYHLRAAQLLAGKVLDYYNEGWGGDIDGSMVEDWILKSGCAVTIPMDTDNENECDEERCSNCDGGCDFCHRYTPAAQAAMLAAEEMK